MAGLYAFDLKVTNTNRTIAVYYEHPEWFRPLFAELDRRGVSYLPLDAASHTFEPGRRGDYAIFFNRMSASASLRGNGNAIFYTRYLINDLAENGVRVINGEKAFAIETSKAMQLSLLNSLGIDHPRAVVVNHPAAILKAADRLEFPLLVKPNIGGRGSGIVLFNTPVELLDAMESGQIDLGPDHTALVQEFVTKRGGCIQRIETLGGKFLYGLKIYPTDENFNLCPAEVCLIENAPASADICLVDGPASGLRIEKFDPPAEIIETVERIAAAAELDLGGVEYLIDERTGKALFYDINALSNFVAGGAAIVGFDPHERLVDFLEKELDLCDTVTGCRSLVAG